MDPRDLDAQVRVVQSTVWVLIVGALSALAASCAQSLSLPTGPAAAEPLAAPTSLSSAFVAEIPESRDSPIVSPQAGGDKPEVVQTLSASATACPASSTPTDAQATVTGTTSPVSPTYTPTSMPGLATLIAPSDGATLPQPVAPDQWAFSWSGRTGPCYAALVIDGPGGRRLGSSYIPWQDAQGYSYTYTASETLPDDALGPWTWFVEIHCPGGTSRSLTRTFWVRAGPPIPTAPTITPPSPPGGTATTQPGLILRGTVRREHGTGLANVAIIRAFAGYIGEVVATTGPDGSYVSAFQYIPGDEMVRVWAQAPGYTFQPASATNWENGSYLWRHYYGQEDHTLDFLAVPAVPPPTVQPGLILRGNVRLEGGAGLPNVSIHRAFAGYIGDLVATTSPDGSYQTAFQYIPGDEMVRVWAQASGYTFRPASSTYWEDGVYLWRHYRGREDLTLDFIAIPGLTPSPTPTIRPTSAPTIMPTSLPGPATLLRPSDGEALPQPVAPGEWYFSWSGRTGPCSSFMRIDGPGGRQVGCTYVSYQQGGYRYDYSTGEDLPDDALGPWTWWVEIRRPGGSSQSETRTFWVMSAQILTPTPQPQARARDTAIIGSP